MINDKIWKAKFEELLISFESWYDYDTHKKDKDYYINQINKNNISQLNKVEFIDFFYNFVSEGGKIQSGGDRTKNQFKKMLDANYDSFREFVLEPFNNSFNLEDWLHRIQNFKHFGFGIATIYLNRIDENQYSIINNKSKDALKKLGFDIPSDDVKSYFKIKGIQEQLIHEFPQLNNFYKTDSLNHYIIGTLEGKIKYTEIFLLEDLWNQCKDNVIKKIDSSKNWSNDLQDKIKKYSNINKTQDIIDINDLWFSNNHISNVSYFMEKNETGLSIYKDATKIILDKNKKIGKLLFDCISLFNNDKRYKGKKLGGQVSQIIRTIFTLRNINFSIIDISRINMLLSVLKYGNEINIKNITENKDLNILDEAILFLSKITNIIANYENINNIEKRKILWYITEELESKNQSSLNYWIFQGNPKIFNIIDALKENNLITWSVKNHKENIRPGDKIILWIVGKNSGCYALCTVKTEVKKMKDYEVEEKYYIEKNINVEDNKVEIKIDYNLAKNPILLNDIKNKLELSNFKGGNQGTNFISTKDEYEFFLNYMKQDRRNIMQKNDLSLNTILYGPPGTGKTYYTINKALSIILHKEKIDKIIFNDNEIDIAEVRNIIVGFENNNFIQKKEREKLSELYKFYKGKGQIDFITFHQSFSYEEFIEGIKPNTDNSDKLSYTIEDGIFKSICINADVKSDSLKSEYDFDENKINFFKMSLGNTLKGEEDILNFCIENNIISLGYGDDIDFSDCDTKDKIKIKYTEKYPDIGSFAIEAVHRFRNWMNKDDIVLISYGNLKFTAIGKIIGDYYFDKNSDIRFNHFRKIEWLFEGKEIPVNQILKDKVLSQQAIYMFYKKDIIFNNIRDIVKPSQNIIDKNYVLIIDEINRGNISKIFGELITLIEDDKRLGKENEIKTRLPYKKKEFGVPSNLYIIGTMNTADRSIALMDTALRRRFTFIEMMPKPELLTEVIDGINLSEMLKRINKRIEYLYDRDHTIGHAYFMNIKDMDGLADVFQNRIIPLLQEYFYDDWKKIRLVLGNNNKEDNDDKTFIKKIEINTNKLFGSKNDIDELEGKELYEINKSAFNNPDAYKSIYENNNQ